MRGAGRGSIRVDMQVAERVDEIARLESRDLRHHQRQQRVTRDVERHAEKQIRAALVKLAA
jgi:predicted transcriptional regulator